jgi:hypothetical protein
MKANARKRKEMKAKVLYFLSFIFPNPGFSMSYERFKQKNLSRSVEATRNAQNAWLRSFSSDIAAPRPGIPATGKDIAQILLFEKKFL